MFVCFFSETLICLWKRNHMVFMQLTTNRYIQFLPFHQIESQNIFIQLDTKQLDKKHVKITPWNSECRGWRDEGHALAHPGYAPYYYYFIVPTFLKSYMKIEFICNQDFQDQGDIALCKELGHHSEYKFCVKHLHLQWIIHMNSFKS